MKAALRFASSIATAGAVGALLLASPPAQAADEDPVELKEEPEDMPDDEADGAEGKASASFSSEEGFKSDGFGKGWMKRFVPEPGLFELGIFGGLMFPSSDHNLQDEKANHQPFAAIAPEIGLRAAYFPLSFLGIEAEGALLPTKTRGDNESAMLYTVRGHLIAQLPFWRITPFLVIGGGMLGSSSDPMGGDVDPAMHAGLGVKVGINRWLSARLDVRDTLSQKNDAEDGVQTHHPEVLLGLSFVFGRSDEKDSDKDGIPDVADECPKEKGPEPTGCPRQDTDGDGFMDDEDECPKVAGVDPDGCPKSEDDDADGDGILDKDDKCPKKPESKNNYQDDDGCPDEIPKELAAFTGVIQGIEFDTNKATIRRSSRPVLDKAAKVLKKYKDIHILIEGHTDSDGTREHNLKLSQRRAAAVKTYLVRKGVGAKRIKTRGAGPDEPIASNDTKKGKQKNRRIEFKVVK